MRTSKRALWLVAGTVLVLGLTVASAVGKPLPVEKGNATADQFVASTGCGCHAALVEQWSKSMHAQALTDPLYLTKLADANKATNGAIGPFCNKCHGPAATMAGEFGKSPMSPGANDAVGCSFCHQVTGLLPGIPANTSHLVEANGVRRAQLKDPQAPHPAQYSAFHETAEFCGGCHNVNHPINGMHLEATYTEWAASPWAKEGVVCQDCHMSQQPGLIGPSKGQAAGGAPERPNIYRMSFTGAQVALGDAQAATAMLQSAAEITLSAPDVLGAGDKAVVVTVTNKGAGHYLPTGLTEIREMWLEVYSESVTGERADLGERKFGTILQDDAGNSPVELWEATKIKSDDRIPPRESITETYSISLPEGADRATVKAVLRYRSASDEFAKKAGVANPITDMALAEQVVFATEEARVAAAKESLENTTPSKGTNLGIALAGLAAILVVAGWFVVRSRQSKA